MKITVDTNRCTGIGICESIDPDRFEVDDDGTLTIASPTFDQADATLVDEAVRACPARALSISN